MADLSLVLITGRSTKQGCGISEGKMDLQYRDATTIVELNEADMARAGISEGDRVNLKTEYGKAEFKCRRGDVPGGLAFVAFGSRCNQLVGGETDASGMPNSKHVKVELEPASTRQSRGDAEGAGKN